MPIALESWQGEMQKRSRRSRSRAYPYKAADDFQELNQRSIIFVLGLSKLLEAYLRSASTHPLEIYGSITSALSHHFSILTQQTTTHLFPQHKLRNTFWPIPYFNKSQALSHISATMFPDWIFCIKKTGRTCLNTRTGAWPTHRCLSLLINSPY